MAKGDAGAREDVLTAVPGHLPSKWKGTVDSYLKTQIVFSATVEEGTLGHSMAELEG